MIIIKFPLWGVLGFVLMITGWAFNWFLPGMRSHLFFFPLWLGYCLVIDAWVFVRKGTSLYFRSVPHYICLFLISAPVWWLFELINWRMQNWFYLGRESFTDLQYFIFASINFSTVIPAVFGTAELVGSFRWVKTLKQGPAIQSTLRLTVSLLLAGMSGFLLLMLWPRYFYPFAWVSLYLVFESLNVWMGRRSLLYYLKTGDWRPVISLALGCLITGFFWEFWNYYSYPKWIYHVPFVDFLHVFEMPILGFLGYIPFSFELFVIYHFIESIFNRFTNKSFINIV